MRSGAKQCANVEMTEWEDAMNSRARVVLPDDLLVELDQTVGASRRAEFVADAVREKLLRVRQMRHVQETIGILPDDIPGWVHPEEVTAWLRESRQRDVERITRARPYLADATDTR
jgi:hypothetical protein